MSTTVPGQGVDDAREETATASLATAVLLVDGGLPLAALVAAAAGFAAPRGFWAWGAAANLLRPVADVLLPFYLEWRFEDYRQVAGPPGEFLGMRLLLAAMGFVAFSVLCTAASGAGASLRLLWRRARG